MEYKTKKEVRIDNMVKAGERLYLLAKKIKSELPIKQTEEEVADLLVDYLESERSYRDIMAYFL